MEQELKDLRAEIRQLHDCLDGMRDEQQDLKNGLSTYFIGIDPAIHIRHHNEMVDRADDSREKRKVRYDVIGGIVLALAVQIGSVCWASSNLEKAITTHQIEHK